MQGIAVYTDAEIDCLEIDDDTGLTTPSGTIHLRGEASLPAKYQDR